MGEQAPGEGQRVHWKAETIFKVDRIVLLRCILVLFLCLLPLVAIDMLWP
jgi:hypothetical protein